MRIRIGRGFKVKLVKHIPRGYVGMNYYAARSLRIPFPHSKKTILVRRDLGKGARKRTIFHEKIEYELMKRGLSYREAHKIALKAEKKIR